MATKQQSKAKQKNKSRRKPRQKKKSGRTALRLTTGGIRRLFGAGRRTADAGRRATTSAVKHASRRTRMRTRRRRARNQLLAITALIVMSVLLVQSFTTGVLVLWLAAFIACLLVFGGRQKAP